MGMSGPKCGYANAATPVAEAEVVDARMRYESAFNALRRAVTYRLGQEAGDTLREALVDSGSLSSQRKCADKLVIRVLLGKAYSDLIGRHERPVEMVIGFILRTVHENPMEMVDVEVVSHWGIRQGPCELEAQSTGSCSRADQRTELRRRDPARNLHSARRKQHPHSGFAFLYVNFRRRNCWASSFHDPRGIISRQQGRSVRGTQWVDRPSTVATMARHRTDGRIAVLPVGTSRAAASPLRQTGCR